MFVYVFVGGKIIPNLSCKDDEGWTKSKWFFQPLKALRLLGRNFVLRKLKCKKFLNLGSKDNEGWDFSTLKGIRTLKRRVCFKWIFYTKFLFLSTNFSLYFPTPFALKTMVVFIEDGGCQRVNEGWKGLIFCPPPVASRAWQPCLVPLC